MVKKSLKFLLMKLRYFFYNLKFHQVGQGSFLKSPLKIDGAKSITIGSYSYIGYKVWLASMPLTGEGVSKLNIGDNCSIGNFNHIYATNSIEIKDGVLTADKVYISDNIHGYEDVLVNIIDQPIIQKNKVIIETGAWLGENVCVIGASVGRNSVIGSNSVVTSDIPDFCVAVGAPAKIIKRYCFSRKGWFRTNQDGTFKQ